MGRRGCNVDRGENSSRLKALTKNSFSESRGGDKKKVEVAKKFLGESGVECNYLARCRLFLLAFLTLIGSRYGDLIC